MEATPQAVSNWKARDQVPYHVVARLNIEKNEKAGSSIITKNDLLVDNDTVSLSDIILKLSEQLKIILLIPFLFMFFTFTYVKLIQPSIYVSSATVLVPDSNTSSSIGGLAGLASQFGVSVPADVKMDLSKPIALSRNFAK